MWPKPSRTLTATWVASKIWPRRWAAWLSLHERLTESSGNPQVVWSTAGCVQALRCVRWMCAGGTESVQAGQPSYHDNKSTRGFLDVNFQDWDKWTRARGRGRGKYSSLPPPPLSPTIHLTPPYRVAPLYSSQAPSILKVQYRGWLVSFSA